MTDRISPIIAVMLLVAVAVAAVGAYFVWHGAQPTTQQIQSPKTYDPVTSQFDTLKWAGILILGALAVGAYLKNYLQRREESEDKIPKGNLFTGPGGTGKTVFKKEYNINEMEAILEQAFAEREAKEYVDRMKVSQAEMDRELQRMKSCYRGKYSEDDKGKRREG